MVIFLEAALSQLQPGKSDRSNNKWKVPQECVFLFGVGNDLGCWLLPPLFPGFMQWVTLTLQHSETNTSITNLMSRFVGRGTPLSNENSGFGSEAETCTAGNVLWGGWNPLLWLCWGHWPWWQHGAPLSGAGQLFRLKEELKSNSSLFLTCWPRGSLPLYRYKGNVWEHSIKFSLNEMEPPATRAGKGLWGSPLVLVNKIVNSSSYLSTATTADCWWSVWILRQISSRKHNY